MQLRTRLEPHGHAQPGDVHEAQLPQVEDNRSFVEGGVHITFEGGDGRAVELAVHLDQRRRSDAP